MKKILTLLCLCCLCIGGAWGAAPVNTILWGENFAHFGTKNPSVAGTGIGTTIYGGATITYNQSSTNTKAYNENNAGGTAPELLLSKGGNTWTISGIKTGSAKEMNLTFLSNKTYFSVTISSDAYTVTGSEKSWIFALKEGKTAPTTISITIKNTSSDTNARIDNVQLIVTEKGEVPTYTVTLNDDNSTLTETEGGEGVSLPSRTSTNTEYTFAGWSTTNVETETTTAPTIIPAGTYHPTANITLFPVYKRVIGDEPVETLAQTLKYDTWTYYGSTTDKGSYRLFHSESYIESAEFDLSTLSKVVVYGGTFGGGSYNSLAIGDGTNTWKSVTVSGSSQTGTNTYTDGTALSGTGKLRITSNSGSASSNGVRISKVEIYTKPIQIKYYISNPTVAPTKTLTSIEVFGTSAEFWKGDSFNHEGMTVTAHYSDAEDEDVTAKSTFSGYDMSTSGEQTVTVSYTEAGITKEASYTINVVAPTLTSISVSGQTTSFYVGDEFVFDGKVTATYNNGAEVDVTESVTFDGYDNKAEGLQTITVSYNEITTTYDITVSPIPEKTIAQFIADEGGKCYLAGVVSNITNPTYGNFDLTDESGSIYVYGCLTSNGEAQKFSELDITVGDKIKVLASTYKLYNNKAEAVDVVFVEELQNVSTSYTLTFDVDGNGTVAVTEYGVLVEPNDDGEYTIREGANVSITATSDNHYKFSTWLCDVEGAEENDNVLTFTMPASDTEVMLEFVPKASYTIEYYDFEKLLATETVEEGDALNAPTISKDGWQFVGWTEDVNYEQSTESPVLFDLTSSLNDNLTLCAVFSKSEGGDNDSYKKVTSQLSDWRGDYLIAYSDDVFMDGSLAGGKDGVGAAQSHVAPGDALSTDKNTISATWGDEHYVTIEAIDDADLSKEYVIKSHSADTPYFYQSSNSNGMASTDNKATAANYPITVTFNSADDIAIALGGKAKGAILHYNANEGSTGEMFRFYKDGGQKAIYLYKKTSSSVTKYSINPAQAFELAFNKYGIATMYLDYAVSIPEGVEVSYVSGVEGTSVKEQTITIAIPANTGVIVRGTENGSATFTQTDDVNAIEGNMLDGTTDDSKLFNEEGFVYYILSAKNGVVGFYWDSKTQDEGASANCGKNKALLAVPYSAENAVKAFYTFGGNDDVDAINSINADKKQMDGAIYNLNGQRLNALQKGINIVNGKKIYVK